MTERAFLRPVLEILGAYWKSERWTLIVVAFVVVLASAANVGAPYLFSRVLDQIEQERAARDLAVGIAVYAAMLGAGSALQHAVQYLSFMSAENLNFIASTRFFERLLQKDVRFFVEHNPAEIQSASSRGAIALSTIVQLGLSVFVPGATQIFLTLVTLGVVINMEVVVAVALYGFVAVSLTLASAKRARRFLDEAIEAGQANARFLGNAMNAMETLRHFGASGWISQRFSKKALMIRDSWRAYVLKRLGYILVLGACLAVQFAVTLGLLFPRYETGTISIGDIVLFNTLILQLNGPFEMIANAIDNLMRVRSYLTPLARMWSEPDERPDDHASPFISEGAHIEFEDVGFEYDGGRGIQGVCFTAKRGAITFLVGETGSGKSTIFKLALKSIEPSVGRVLIDGVDLASIDRASWYASVAVVPQDIVLLNESLADNILLGRPRSNARLRRAAQKAAVLDFVDELPDGFNATVGERGLRLSGGERQRIAIARALYGEPSVLFLDEASSALDDETERDIMHNIRMLANEVTVLAITHRRGIIASSDTVVDLSKDDTR